MVVSLATGSLAFNGGVPPSQAPVESPTVDPVVELSISNEPDKVTASAAPPESDQSMMPGAVDNGSPLIAKTVEKTSSEHRSEDSAVISIEQQETMPGSDADDDTLPGSNEALEAPPKETWKRGMYLLYICLGILGVAMIALGVALGTGGASSSKSALASIDTRSSSNSPSMSPSNSPSGAPSDVPSKSPSERPSGCPSSSPSTVPSASPSTAPTSLPSGAPTEVPSASPSQAPSQDPSASPSTSPSTSPSIAPTSIPSAIPSSLPSSTPTLSSSPSASPSASPSSQPSVSSAPSGCPSEVPSSAPTVTPQPTLIQATFLPGNLTRMEVGLLLSEGLRARIIARTGEYVEYADGNFSDVVFHGRPDFGATFPDTRSTNENGWLYTSNSEMEELGQGGVGAFAFDSDGNVLEYKMVLENTTMNCGGGRTPWNTWVSCEEIEFTGLIYQVDPYGDREAEPMTIGMETGRWESFAYDVRNRDVPRFFATEDHNKGTVRRFTPDNVTWDTPWDMLHSEGVVDYLIVHPNDERTGGTFEWTNNVLAAKSNARTYYPQSEGIDIFGAEMYVVCKRIKQIFTFNLDDMTYFNQSTVTGLFDGGPDQMQRIVGNSGDLLFFTEEGGKDAGIHARDGEGRFYTILESPEYIDETTGLAFSPDGMHMYVAYQANGLLFDVWREDGLPFQARTLNVKYHKRGDL